jgi:hypothetical protein
MATTRICALAVGVVFIGACGSDGDSESGSGDENGTETEQAEPDDAGDAQDAAQTDDAQTDEAQTDDESDISDIADGLEAVQESEGGGGASLTVDGQTWEFPSVLCAFGEDQIGQPGAVFNMSAIADGLQLYASIDDSGESHSLSINDIEDFENPSVALSASPFSVAASGAPADFLTLDGTSVSGDVVLIDDTTGEPTSEPAQFSATCP